MLCAWECRERQDVQEHQVGLPLKPTLCCQVTPDVTGRQNRAYALEGIWFRFFLIRKFERHNAALFKQESRYMEQFRQTVRCKTSEFALTNRLSPKSATGFLISACQVSFKFLPKTLRAAAFFNVKSHQAFRLSLNLIT